MQIRFAQKHDAAAIAALHLQSWQQTYRGTLSDDYLDQQAAGERLAQWQQRLTLPAPQQRVWLLEQDHQLIGFCCAYLNHDARWGSYIDNLHVAQAAQGQGLGSLLLAKVAQTVLDKYTNKGIYLYCNQSNTTGRYFYERRGARNEGEYEWLAPDGSRVATCLYFWPQASQLIIEQGVNV